MHDIKSRIWEKKLKKLIQTVIQSDAIERIHFLKDVIQYIHML